jgi:hypothetical protein
MGIFGLFKTTMLFVAKMKDELECFCQSNTLLGLPILWFNLAMLMDCLRQS